MLHSITIASQYFTVPVTQTTDSAETKSYFFAFQVLYPNNGNDKFDPLRNLGKQFSCAMFYTKVQGTHNGRRELGRHF